MNLPYTDRRMATGLEVAGMTVTAIEPLKRARIQFDHPDFAVDLEWDAILPMQDAIEPTKGGADDGFAKEIAHLHMEGTCALRGTGSIRGGGVFALHGAGFRVFAAGPRHRDFLKHHTPASPLIATGFSIPPPHTPPHARN